MKYTSWYNSQNETTRAYLDRTPVWHDRDMMFAFVGGILLGLIVGLIL